jgi:hypothetical protein
VPGLSLLSPWFLAGLLAVAVPFVLHLLAREAAPTVHFSAVRFIRRAPVERTRRRRVSDPLLLLLRMAALALLALAFARPFLPGSAGVVPATLVAVDRSLSVSGPVEWRAVLETARAAIDLAPGGGAVGLLAFDDRVDVVLAPGHDRRAAAAALDRLEPTAGGANAGLALTRAVDLLDGRGGRVVVVSDLQRSARRADVLAIVPGSVVVEVMVVPPAPSNLAVRSVTREDRGTSVVVVNHGPTPRSTQVSLDVDGRAVEDLPVELDPGVAREVLFTADLPSEGVAIARVRDGEGPTFDDVRYHVLDPRPPLRAGIVTSADAAPEASLYIERALRVASTDVDIDVTVVPAADPSLDEVGMFDELATVILTGTRGLDRRARDRIAAFVREGGGLLLVAGPDTEPGVVRDLFGSDLRLDLEAAGPGAWPATFAASEIRHPIFSAMGPYVAHLADVRVHGGLRIVPGDRWRTIARFTNDEAAVAEATHGEGRVIVFASDLGQAWNAWPVHPTFLPWLHETVSYLAARAAVPSAVVVADVPEGVARVPGTFETGTPRRRVAVNVDPRDSSIDVDSEAEFLARVGFEAVDDERVTLQASMAREADQGLWRLVVLAVVALLVVEGLLASRTRSRAAAPESGD